MNEIQTTLQESLFLDFIRYIDRPEKTTRTYLTNLKQFAAWLKYEGIKAPTRQDILAYKAFLSGEHPAIMLDPESVRGWKYRTACNGDPVKLTCRPNTTAQYLRSVCQFFKWTAATGIYPNIADNIHAPKIRHDQHSKEALTPADVLAIEHVIRAKSAQKATEAAQAKKDTAGRKSRVNEQGKRLYALFLLAVNAGLRTVEISRANVKDLTTKGGNAYLYIWGKGHAEPDHKKPIAPEVYRAISDYLESRRDTITPNSPLFVATGNRSGGARIAPTTISRMLKTAMKQAGYNSERLTAHSLRHTTGTSIQAITGNIYLTQNYMRHSNPATTEIYLHNDTEQTEIELAKELYKLYHSAKN